MRARKRERSAYELVHLRALEAAHKMLTNGFEEMVVANGLLCDALDHYCEMAGWSFDEQRYERFYLATAKAWKREVRDKGDGVNLGAALDICLAVGAEAAGYPWPEVSPRKRASAA